MHFHFLDAKVVFSELNSSHAKIVSAYIVPYLSIIFRCALYFRNDDVITATPC